MKKQHTIPNRSKDKPCKKKEPPEASLPTFDLLRGRVPPCKDPVQYYVSVIVVTAFWTFAVYMIGYWVFSIPAAYNLVAVAKKLISLFPGVPP
ncbi:MAG: hypothetical protein ABW019_15500 [Chitinophagaceae bacterium]